MVYGFYVIMLKKIIWFTKMFQFYDDFIEQKLQKLEVPCRAFQLGRSI